MITWGISALHHDAAITVTRDNEILFAGHAERYSKIKNDPFLNTEIVNEALYYGKPDCIVWYESPFKKKLRYIYSGQYNRLLENPYKYVKGFLGKTDMYTVDHHTSHAHAGYSTSKFEDAAIVVVDAIGEWTTVSVWEAKGKTLKCIYKQGYPHSLGLLYSAFTELCGLKPNEEEYILMGMAAYGESDMSEFIHNDLIETFEPPLLILSQNVHKGLPKHYQNFVHDDESKFMIASSVQEIAEAYMVHLIKWTKEKINSDNLILMGGVTLNCVANTKVAEKNYFKNIWIMPNPGDAGSSLGAIAAHHNIKLNWTNPYLGTNINRELNIDRACELLMNINTDGIVGIANGRAEFGPRALGNRSLLANPTGSKIKDRVNHIKKRQKFRPFAPAILAEHVGYYFKLPMSIKSSPYMQFAVECKYPKDFPAICHVDNTSRIQTVSKEDNPVFHELLTEFYRRTGCPMLLNTSLNIKGMPLVNTWTDASEFSRRYNVSVL